MRGKRVLITGAGGFLGSALAAALSAGGWGVIRGRRKIEPDGAPEWRAYDIVQPLALDFLKDVDVVIHAAYIDAKQPNSYESNIRGAERLIAAARGAGARFVFISSLSASANARSSYGRQKFAIEGLLDLERDLVVRPGLVLGKGGFFGRILGHVKSGRPVPLVDGGRQPLQTVFIDDLIVTLRALLDSGAAGRFVLAESPAVTYLEFFRGLASRAGVPVRFIPIPSWLLLAFADMARAVHLPSPIDRDNVLGLMDMRYVDPHSELAVPLPRLRAFDGSLDALFSGRGTME